jgi:hypothetical protein
MPHICSAHTVTKGKDLREKVYAIIAVNKIAVMSLAHSDDNGDAAILLLLKPDA